MKKETLKAIMNAITLAVTAIGTEVLEIVEESYDTMEAKSRQAQLKKEWFTRFNSLPASYQVKTHRNRNTIAEVTMDSAVLICDKEGGDVRVATPFVDENGNKMFLVRDIYGVDEYTIPREEVTILYRGSVENCWLRWYTSAKNNLG